MNGMAVQMGGAELVQSTVAQWTGGGLGQGF